MALPLTPIELTAVDPVRNIHRRWRVAAYRDLFGTLLVETQWGRIGVAGQRLVRAFADEESALAYVRRLFAKRARAPNRIGVGYKQNYPRPKSLLY